MKLLINRAAALEVFSGGSVCKDLAALSALLGKHTNVGTEHPDYFSVAVRGQLVSKFRNRPEWHRAINRGATDKHGWTRTITINEIVTNPDASPNLLSTLLMASQPVGSMVLPANGVVEGMESTVLGATLAGTEVVFEIHFRSTVPSETRVPEWRYYEDRLQDYSYLTENQLAFHLAQPVIGFYHDYTPPPDHEEPETGGVLDEETSLAEHQRRIDAAARASYEEYYKDRDEPVLTDVGLVNVKSATQLFEHGYRVALANPEFCHPPGEGQCPPVVLLARFKAYAELMPELVDPYTNVGIKRRLIDGKYFINFRYPVEGGSALSDWFEVTE